MGNRKIYVAEDQPLQLKLIRRILESRGEYEATFFNDGLQLYRKVLESPPDLLIADILLPSLSGLAIASLLKFHDGYNGVRILLISSITDDDIEQQAREAGADSFLPKPFEVEALLERLSRLQ